MFFSHIKNDDWMTEGTDRTSVHRGVTSDVFGVPISNFITERNGPFDLNISPSILRWFPVGFSKLILKECHQVVGEEPRPVVHSAFLPYRAGLTGYELKRRTTKTSKR